MPADIVSLVSNVLKRAVDRDRPGLDDRAAEDPGPDIIRGDYLSVAQFRQAGENLAAHGATDLPAFRPFEIARRIRQNEKDILTLYRATAMAADRGEMITPAAEWLVDNYYLVEESMREVRRDLPRRFVHELPGIDAGDGHVLARTLALAWVFVAHADSAVSEPPLNALVEGFQSVDTLSIGELWALPSMLRFMLIENLRRIMIRVERSRHMRMKANSAADDLARCRDETACLAVLDALRPLMADTSFVTQLLYRLREGSEHGSSVALTWLKSELQRLGTDTDEVLHSEQNAVSSGNVMMGNIVRGLRKLDDIDWTIWFEQMSVIDTVLRAGSDFAAVDFASRDHYRNEIERLAKGSALSEEAVARKVVALAASRQGGGQDQAAYPAADNVGTYLGGPGVGELERLIGYRCGPALEFSRFWRSLGWLAIGLPVLVLTALLVILAGVFLFVMDVGWAGAVVLLVLFSLPASEAASGLVQTLVGLLVKPSRIIGYEYRNGIPAGARTLVAVPCLLSDRDTVDDLVRTLEVHALSNGHGEVYFALISDWPDAGHEESSEDRALLDHARREIAALNERHCRPDSPRFFLLHRRRLFNESQGVWMGWERKRGKLDELNLFLRHDRDTNFLAPFHPLPDDIRYVMTLDADTRLTRDTVVRLVGKMAHPVNQPVLDPDTSSVRAGYALLQPRVTPSLTTGVDASTFQRVFSVNRGIDPYVFTVSDMYQDLTGEGTFTGKGLYHVDAITSALTGRIRENTVLSHDLLEGSIARCGLTTDVELVEDFPTRYEVEMSRQHRWARGDWQLLPYMLDAGNGISAIGRWKMFDNLRRSLVPVGWLLASLLGWLSLNGAALAIWQAVLIVSLFTAPTLSLISGMIPRRADIVMVAHLRSVAGDMLSATAQVMLRIVFIAHGAALMADAVIRTLYRLFFSRRKMLEWRTAAQADKNAFTTPGDYLRGLWQGPAIALFATGLLWLSAVGPQQMAVAAPFLVVWALSPLVAWYVSQPAETEDRLDMPQAVEQGLRIFARRTWRFFDHFVTAGQNHLPPDNFQENPEPVIAARTSPTNIGVYLLSVISAREFGWISFEDTIERLERTIDTLERMEKFRGHIFNWYTTDTLTPMEPRYVSAVDSGNLAGHLVTVSSTLKDWAQAPPAHLQAATGGIVDVAGIVQQALAAIPDDRRTVRPLRKRIEERVAGFSKAIATIEREAEFAAVRLNALRILAGDVQKLALAFHNEIQTEQTSELVYWAGQLAATCEVHVSDTGHNIEAIEALRVRLASLRDRSRNLAFAMDFTFLMRQDRRLLSIGYRIETGELDEACYDLLASEARLASLFAIAKGDLPTEHWFKLGRPIVPIGARGALVSWSGSMFEYLMPPLIMQERQGSILNQSNNLAVREQIAYGKLLATPWGISEAALNARDPAMTYQYSNFGVPRLGLKRGLGHDAVIAPYASMLAAQYAPEAAFENLQRLGRLGALGCYGFYDAVDFTPSRVPEGQSHAVVYNYMAHHQGMSIAAIANIVFHGRLRQRFHADPVIESGELLLQERVPRDVPVMMAKHELNDPGLGESDLARPEIRRIEQPADSDRAVLLLSNGHYSVMMTATGGSVSHWNGQAVTRSCPDPTEERTGQAIFLGDMETGAWWSATAWPRPMRQPATGTEATTAIFYDHKAEFFRTAGTLSSEVECIVATDFDAEGRRITISNQGTAERHIAVTSYLELVDGPVAEDRAHPAYAKLFVHSDISADRAVIYSERNRRDPKDPAMVVAHLIGDDIGARRTQSEVDRRVFLGRGRNLFDARALDPRITLAGQSGYTLDPIAALRRVVRVPAGKSVRLCFWTVAAPDRADAETAVARLRHGDSFEAEMTKAWTRSQVQLHHLGLTSRQAVSIQGLARHLIFPDSGMRPGERAFPFSHSIQPALWPLSISGDDPIMVLVLDDEADLKMVEKVLGAQEYLSSRGLTCDLAILNERSASYAQDFQHAIDRLCEHARLRAHQAHDKNHIFPVRRDLMDDRTHAALMASASVMLHARNGELADQIARARRPMASITPPFEPLRGLQAPLVIAHKGAGGGNASQEPGHDLETQPPHSQPLFSDQPTPVSTEGLSLWNGYGGFGEDGRTYVVRLRGGEATPQPWINVITNGDFGFHVSAEGAAYSWSCNARDFQLTPWTNDPVSNRPGEALFLVDVETGAIISPFAAFSANPVIHFEARHGLGYSAFRSWQEGLELVLTQTVDPSDPVKIQNLAIRNDSDKRRHLKLYVYAEWVLATQRPASAAHIRAEFVETDGILTARNPFSIAYGDRTAFLALDTPSVEHTANRREFIGKGGSILSPLAVRRLARLGGNTDTAGDPCAALACEITLEPGQTRSLKVLLGDADGSKQACEIVARARKRPFDEVLAEQAADWDARNARLNIQTGEAALDYLVNGWLPYQTLQCRIRARAAFYQASGAFGFRDQLQDSLAFLLSEPEIVRDQILRTSARQFIEGDVQHWWLPESGSGVRSTISDDVVWLAFGLVDYIETSEDFAILDERVSFLEGPPVPADAHDIFFTPVRSAQEASVYEHAARALDLAIVRTGASGLPLILGGDWNDGLNRVGVQGRGESVWLGWFLAGTLERFIPLCQRMQDDARSKAYRAHLERLLAALEDTGWDGAWYRRASHDDGSLLGSSGSNTCRIDSIAQSWSVLSGLGRPDRMAAAMDAVMEHLVDDDLRIVRLFTPPFDMRQNDAGTVSDPGYIRAYPPGVRENGGQYTHASAWVVLALAKLGRADEAWRCLSYLLPTSHAHDKTGAARYRVEPYVIAADIYGEGTLAGRGGWTWYTGSSGWIYRAATEGILGLKKKGNRLFIRPALPSHWQGYAMTLEIDGQTLSIEVSAGTETGDRRYQVTINDQRVDDIATAGFQLSD